MLVLPMETGLARPLLLMVATLGVLDDQVTDVVTLLVDPSENVAVAVNCWVWARLNDIVALAGLMARLVTVLLLTVSVALAVTLLVDFAVIVVVPNATPVASPEVSIVAMAGEEDVQVTCEVTSPVLLLPKVAVALNCWVAVGFTKALVGETASETIVVDLGKKPGQPYQPPNIIASGSAMENFQSFENPVLDTIPAPIPGAPKLTFLPPFGGTQHCGSILPAPQSLRRAAIRSGKQSSTDCSSAMGLEFPRLRSRPAAAHRGMSHASQTSCRTRAMIRLWAAS
jgi:hypothetical protein